jgi:hypothetical protein
MSTIAVPKLIRRKIALIEDLCKKRDVARLRQLRDNSKDLKIDLYHHSEGTASYFHDTEKRYYTELEITKRADEMLGKGEWSISVVLPYKANILFTSGMANAMKYN